MERIFMKEQEVLRANIAEMEFAITEKLVLHVLLIVEVVLFPHLLVEGVLERAVALMTGNAQIGFL